MNRKHDAGKGDNRRPSSISDKEMELRWKMAFGTKDEKEQAKQNLETLVKSKARRSS